MGSADAVFDIRVTASAGRDEVRLSDGGPLIVRVKEPPVRGKANRAVLKLLARKLGVPRSSIRIEAGESGRNKRVRVDGGGEAFKRVFGPPASNL
jgi:uncharacterized protein (TIGR00251 family)